MSEQIFHLNEDGKLEPMNEQRYSDEDYLQKLVADHPELLSGVETDSGNRRPWILVRREQGISDREDAGNRWSVDHLFVDQNAVPILVEAKRRDNPEIRRRIVAQMLDYASHARFTLKAEALRREFEERCRVAGQDPDEVLSMLLPEEELEPDSFWEDVENNLRAAKIRLLFVADEIPEELQRIVEFLNEQMPRIEVLAVEIKQFKGDAGSTLVPRVIGRTAESVGTATRSSGRRHQLDHETFLAQIPSLEGQQAASRILAVGNKYGARMRGRSGLSIRIRTPALPRPGRVTVAWLWPEPGRLFFGGTRDFSFGSGNSSPEFFNSLPDELRQLLESWTDQIGECPSATEISTSGIRAYAFTHQAAAQNIDIICERLDRVLKELSELQLAAE